MVFTPLWEETLELIKKGILSKMSIGFSALRERTENDILIYESIRIYESSLVLWPAYKSSSVDARNKEEKIYLPPELYL